MAVTKPTVLIVTGAWHTPAFYEPFADLLGSHGYEALCPLLPTCEPDALSQTPVPDMHSDARLVRQHLDRLVVEQGKHVLMLPHSYGGVPTLQAVDKGLSVAARSAAGQSGGVIGIMAMTAFVLPTNASLESFTGGKPAPFIAIDDRGMTSLVDPKTLLLGDLTPDAKDHWASLLVEQPAKAHAAPVEPDPVAYKFLPFGYLKCELDRMITLPIQEAMLEGARKDGAISITEYQIPASHSPYLSKPNETLGCIEEFIKTLQV